MTTMERLEMNDTRNMALPCFLTGLATGVVLTLLLAPQSGEATRSLIGRKVKKGEDWVKEAAAGAEEKVLVQTAGLRSRVKEMTDEITRS